MSFAMMATALADNLQMTLKWQPSKKQLTGQQSMTLPGGKGLPTFVTNMETEASFVNAKEGHAGVLVKIGGSLFLLLMYNQRHSTCSAYVLDPSRKSGNRIKGAVNTGKTIRGVFDAVKPAVKCQFTKKRGGNWSPFKA